MGFVLMGTLVYRLSFIEWTNVLPTIALLVGLGLACWWVGRTPITADFQVKLRAWLSAAAISILVGLYAFGGVLKLGGFSLYGLQATMEHRLERDFEAELAMRDDSVDPLLASDAADHDGEIRWHAYTENRLGRLLEAERTVLVDFTADWCVTCKTLEATVLDTPDVRRVLRENGVLTLLADWSNGSPEITRKLESLGSKQVPLLAIYPSGETESPIVLQGFYTKSQLLAALEEAGPSADIAQGPENRVAALQVAE
jgi:thiol:disulfide interchange protein